VWYTGSGSWVRRLEGRRQANSKELWEQKFRVTGGARLGVSPLPFIYFTKPHCVGYKKYTGGGSEGGENEWGSKRLPARFRPSRRTSVWMAGRGLGHHTNQVGCGKGCGLEFVKEEIITIRIPLRLG